ncbi:N-hydroxyarylamine O-acetyltransferase [Desulfobotulus alkaliphilus]|uniref:N-hydroxyarylamine O-acetyltransferase n=1 Tax=Desulfobotulus alkaliphilus TaxID=622671 RepID=A0A562QW74_9BACT|nr:arylamine N-acetyltransferase [Desulfobotulus alkaliphilus]TWI61017.1 N-hydroxyarylamine O-acetyltransferase [Desulfobotulus alkaliphilus]
MDTTAYLERINFKGSLLPTAETLRRLHIAHLLTVPFENLSIHWGEPIILDDEALFEKVVMRKRGGFCYELNGLFASLLRALGFDVVMLAGCVINDRGKFGPEFDHMALMVTLKEQWIADVGFGDSFREPLRLVNRWEQKQGKYAYCIEEDSSGRLILTRRNENGEWKSLYRFSCKPYQYSDYKKMCHYHQTSSESHFTQQRICSLATEKGRITLSGTQLIITQGCERQVQELVNEEEYAEVLRVHFGIEPH